MALVTLKEMLTRAQAEKYAVAMFDVFNLEMLQGVMNAAEKLNSPVIVAYGEGCEEHTDIRYFSTLVRKMAAMTDIPVVLHWDHANTMSSIRKAIDAGFTSVMLDASADEYEENIRRTKEVVELCKPLGISVEAELGHVGDEGVFDVKNYRYTEPDKAQQFVERTGIDALAVAIGNVHGVYKSEPHINYEILREIRKTVTVPLVLHGASGLSEEIIRNAVHEGISKINIFTDLCLAPIDAAKEEKLSFEEISYDELTKMSQKAIQKVAEQKIQLFGSADKAWRA